MAISKKFTILVIDDDHDAREAIDLALKEQFRILHAREGEEGYNVAKAERPQLVILDINMPGRDGIWACQQLRTDEQTRPIPVVILSARHTLEQKLEAYSVGADDYLEKPFTMSELKAKVAAKIRRLEEGQPKELKKGNLTLFVDRMEADVSGRRITLSVLEANLLAYFLRHADDVLPRKQILSHVWKNVNVSDRTVDAHIVGLRRKVAEFDYEITTVYGAGYALRPKGNLN